MGWFLADPPLVGSALDLHLSVCVCVHPCVCVCDQLTKLLISFVLEEISFWNLLGDIPRMFVHMFQIILNFLYVCQSVSWLTSLLKLDKYRDISWSGWDIFLKLFGHILEMVVHYFEIILNFLHVCQSVIWLTFLLKLHKYWDISIFG